MIQRRFQHDNFDFNFQMSRTSKIEGIGDVLIEQLPRFGPYVRFCGCMSKACRLLQDKVEKEPEFKAFEKVSVGVEIYPVIFLIWFVSILTMEGTLTAEADELMSDQIHLREKCWLSKNTPLLLVLNEIRCHRFEGPGTTSVKSFGMKMRLWLNAVQ